MKLAYVSPTAALLGLLLAAGSSWAADSKEAKEHADAKKAIAKAKISLAEAVEIALKAVPGGKAVEANIESEGEDVDYFVEALIGGKHKTVEVDAVTGKVEHIESAANEKDEEEKVEAAAAAAPVTLLRAIKIALGAVPEGKAYQADPEMEDGKLQWAVEVVVGDKIKSVDIDASTGKVIEVEDESD